MTTNHIDQLAEWYEQAERITKTNLPNDGDTIIYPGPVKGSYIVEPNTEGWEPQIVYEDEECRILSRAPKPKPAWHDAAAVVGRCSIAPEGNREVFIKSEATPDVWIGEGGYGYTDDLRDVTPLIEAKVTDEARDRVWDELVHHGLIDPQKHRPSQGWTADVVHAALGLETE